MVPDWRKKRSVFGILEYLNEDYSEICIKMWLLDSMKFSVD